MTPRRRRVLFILLFLLIEGVLIACIDRPLSDALRGIDASHPDLINFFRFYTDLGKSNWYLWPSGIAMMLGAAWLRTGWLKADGRAGIMRACHNLAFLFVSVALSGMITDAIKPILGRARPVELLREQMYGFHPLTFHAAWNSMPSGHATTAAALATALVILAPRGRSVWILLAAALAASRVMVNAHYLSDVLAGIMVGLGTTLLVARCRDAQGMFPFMKGIFPIDKSPPVS